MDDRIFLGLNDEQADAVRAVRGPVCILAGAGSGKTTTITRRIANQIATGSFDASEILAVTFTEKAAREMGERLGRIGVPAVRARTFHAEALAQYRRFRPDDPCEIVPSKGQILAQLVSRLPMPHKFTSVRDVATEIEWAKNRRVAPPGYVAAVEKAGHVPTLPPELMAGIYASYERKKERAGLIDFEDLLERTVAMLRDDPRVANVVRGRYRAFTVDEYQDVNLLQQSLLDEWVGDRDDLCVVGDDHQSIFGFTGATAAYLLGFERRYEHAAVFKLTRNYRSTPQVLEVANRLAPRLGGTTKTLRAVLPEGPQPVFRAHETGRDEVEWIVSQCRALRNEGVPWEQIAVLYRINGRSEELEEAFSKDRLPYQVKDGSFLRRPAARAVIARLRRAADQPVDSLVEQVVRGLGYRADIGEDEELEADEATRQADMARILAMAQEFEARLAAGAVDAPEPPAQRGVRGRTKGPVTRADAFIADLEKRFAPEREGRGVQILTYHRSKGLEFEAVFLPRMEDKELPFALSKTAEDLAEERRLLYVGITRAKKYLFISHAAARHGERRRNPKPSPFLAEIRAPRTLGSKPGSVDLSGPKPIPVRATVADDAHALFIALKDWRLRAARANAVPAYVVFHDETLARIAESKPRNVIELGRVNGVGPAKIARYGSEVLELVSAHAG